MLEIEKQMLRTYKKIASKAGLNVFKNSFRAASFEGLLEIVSYLCESGTDIYKANKSASCTLYGVSIQMLLTRQEDT